ncbi:hypothetical protein C1645_842210 [Glomus cerebriforme]|uniref:Uncharacterized protein n=1 Tax=Glomus cerebriforme TaxID=658196 RepID=A0A397S4E6_9GLOM|nr:hypothetical protein C1645_842210 [Glomus cerebriforme]
MTSRRNTKKQSNDFKFSLVSSQENQKPEVAPTKKQGRKKKEDTVSLISINETLNVENIISNNNKVQEQAVAVNDLAKQSQRTKQGSTNPSELLEISDDNLSPDESQISNDDDDAVKFKCNPLALITNNKKGNVIRNNILADLNKASGRSFNNDFCVNNSNSSCLRSPNITHIDNLPHLSITPINYNNSRSNIDNPPRSSITPSINNS